MKRFIVAVGLSASALLVPALSLAGNCYLCGSSSSNGCQQCPFDKDTGDARKACEAKGCKITGTASCSTAANVKTCSLRFQDGNQAPVFVW